VFKFLTKNEAVMVKSTKSMPMLVLSSHGDDHEELELLCAFRRQPDVSQKHIASTFRVEE
jgi:hypothetical protein